VADPSVREQLIEWLRNPTPEVLRLEETIRQDPRAAAIRALLRRLNEASARKPSPAEQEWKAAWEAQVRRIKETYLVSNTLRPPPERSPPDIGHIMPERREPLPAKDNLNDRPGDNEKPGRPSDAKVKAAVKAAGNLGAVNLLAAIREKYPGVRRDQVREASKNIFGTRPAHRPRKDRVE